VREGIGRNGAVPAALVAGVLLVLTACTQQISQQGASPEARPSTPAVTTTPSTAPTPTDSATPVTVPSPPTLPSPAKLIITSVPFHMGEVGLAYTAVTLGAAGGVKPYKWSISSGSLPPGVTVSPGGSTTGKPTAPGTFSFVIRVDDSAGAAAGVPRSILVFRQLAFNVSNATCPDPTTKLNQCSATLNAALHIPYSGGTAGAKPIVKITSVTGGIIRTPGPRAACFTPVSNATTSPPPRMTVSASGGVMTLSAGPPDGKTWCGYSATITFVLVNPSPCGAGFFCTSSNTLSVLFRL
jgi:large repetitive protein